MKIINLKVTDSIHDGELGPKEGIAHAIYKSFVSCDNSIGQKLESTTGI